MIARCKTCNQCEYFDKNDEWGFRLKLSDQKCECGGSFEQMLYTGIVNDYRNRKGVIWELTAIGEFRNKPLTTK